MKKPKNDSVEVDLLSNQCCGGNCCREKSSILKRLSTFMSGNFIMWVYGAILIGCAMAYILVWNYVLSL